MMRRVLVLLLLLVPAVASAQVSVSADRIFLGTQPCIIRSGQGPPAAGGTCDFYLNIATGDLFQNVNGTWIDVTSHPVVDTLTARTSVLTPTLGSVTGPITLDPANGVILPRRNYGVSFGTPTQRFLTMHLGELWAETLVAQEVLATVGGRIMVAPTTTLEADMTVASTSVTVKHNNLRVGDIILMQAAPDGIQKLEFMRVTGAPTGAGPYTNTVTRNIDGSGLTAWLQGDAVVNTGTVGSGNIDLFALRGLFAAPGAGVTSYGPTIVGNVRTGNNFNDIYPRFAIGNLNSVGYGHTSDVYGIAAGVPLTEGNGPNFFIDATYGMHLRYGTTAAVSILPSGVMTIAGNGTGITEINGGNIQTGTVTANQIAAGAITADKIQAGAISAEKITVGGGSNMLRNSECRTGTTDWSIATNAVTPIFGTNYAGYTLLNEQSTCYTQTNAIPAAGLVTYAQSKTFPAIAGGRYEGSVYLGMHRMTGHAYIRFADINGTALANYQGNACVGANNGGPNLSNYCRSGVIGDAPAGTASVTFIVLGIHTGESTPFMFFVRAYLGQTKPGATQISEWSPAGLTEITGGLIKTRSIVADNIAAGSITTTELNFVPAQTSNVIATINASTEGALRITGSKIEITGATTFQAGYNPNDRIPWGSAAYDVNIGQTTINGGQITTNTISAAHLNFVAVQSGNVIAYINASPEALQITGNKIQITGQTTFQAGYNPTSKVEWGSSALDVNSNLTTIDGGKITANSITAREIVGDSLSAITANLGSITAGSIDGINITGTNISGSTITAGNGQVTLNFAGIYLSGSQGNGELHIGGRSIYADCCTISLNGDTVTRGSQYVDSRLQVEGDGEIKGGLTVQGSVAINGNWLDVYHDSHFIGDIHADANISARDVSAGSFRQTASGGNYYWDGTPPTFDADNVQWSSGCRCFGKDNSSARYKENISDWAPDDPLAILKLPLKAYDLKAQPQYETPIPAQRGLVGLIVEDLIKIAPKAVLLDDQGRPDGVRRGAFEVYLLAAIKAVNDKTPRSGLVEELQAQIRDLQQRLAALEAKGKDK